MMRFGRSRRFIRSRGPLILVAVLAVAVVAGLVDVVGSWGTTGPASAAEAAATTAASPATAAATTAAAPAATAPAVRTEYVTVPAPVRAAACSTSKARRRSLAGAADRCRTRGARRSGLALH